uniref:hypothetical protein n=1 Tax=Milkweed yellows phytoplasma TaxID=208434 RepID=UPI00036F048B|nr:hypothetical protein [Milkweed yellows phytoplasma]
MKMNIFKPNKKHFYIISILFLTSVIFLLIISHALAVTKDAIKKKTDKGIYELSKQISHEIKQKSHKIDEVTNKFLEKMDSWDKDLKEDKDKMVKDLSKALRLKMDNLENSLTKELIPKHLEQLIKKAEGKIEAFNTQEITQKILVILDQKVKALADDLAKTIKIAIYNLGQSIEKDKKTLMDNITGKINSWDKSLKEDKKQIIEKISTALDNLEKATKAAKEKMEDIEDNIHVKDIVESLKTSINQLPPQLIQTIKDLIKESLPTWLGGGYNSR